MSEVRIFTNRKILICVMVDFISFPDRHYDSVMGIQGPLVVFCWLDTIRNDST